MQDVAIRKQIRFGTHDGHALTGDYYGPQGPGKYPALVALHGGGWKLGSSDTYEYWGQALAEQGYALFSVNYRLVQGAENLYPASVLDARAAVQFLRSNAEEFQVDPDRLGLMGDSAGAHLSALVALAGSAPPFSDTYRDDPYSEVSTQVKIVVGVYGVYDLLGQWQHDQIARPLDQITEGLLGKSPMESKKLYHEASPMTYTTLDNNGTAFLVVWGTEDDLVDTASQSGEFVTALKQAGFFVRTVIVPGAPHFWMGDPLDEPASHTAFLAPRLLRFLRERL